MLPAEYTTKQDLTVDELNDFLDSIEPQIFDSTVQFWDRQKNEYKSFKEEIENTNEKL